MHKLSINATLLHPRLHLRLIASAAIDKGEEVLRCEASELQEEKSFRTIQVGENQHVRNALLDYMDHSCAPNVVFVVENLTFVALRPIEPNEAITFFYPGSELELSRAFDCACGADRCLGRIRGGFYIRSEQMSWALEMGYCTSFMASNFKRLIR